MSESCILCAVIHHSFLAATATITILCEHDAGSRSVSLMLIACLLCWSERQPIVSPLCFPSQRCLYNPVEPPEMFLSCPAAPLKFLTWHTKNQKPVKELGESYYERNSLKMVLLWELNVKYELCWTLIQQQYKGVVERWWPERRMMSSLQFCFNISAWKENKKSSYS